MYYWFCFKLSGYRIATYRNPECVIVSWDVTGLKPFDTKSLVKDYISFCFGKG